LPHKRRQNPHIRRFLAKGNPVLAAKIALVKRKVLIRKTEPEEPVEERHAPALERQLLRSSVLSMAAHRHCCSRCGRSPLVGERIQVFATRDDREHALCDLCASGAGAPVRMERVRPRQRTLVISRAA
jgi:hypothetical protein